MNNRLTSSNLKEVLIQLERADSQKKILIKNIYKEYEIYFKIVRKYIHTAAEKGIFALYSDLPNSSKVLNSSELNNLLKKNINLLINSKLPFITIEQLKLDDIKKSEKQLLNLNHLKELLEFKEYQSVNFDYENELLSQESLEFHCNNNLNTLQYYESPSEDLGSSLNLDERFDLNTFSKQHNSKEIEYNKNVVDPVLELIDETNDNKLKNIEIKIDKSSDVFISNDNLNFFEFIDKSFSNFLLTISHEINSELFKKNLIKKIISEDTFKCLSNKDYIIRHPHPFVIRYDLNPNNFPLDIIKSSDIYLFNITKVELEFYNLNLSICRNNINELKNKFLLLNKKEKYWKHKELTLKN